MRIVALIKFIEETKQQIALFCITCYASFNSSHHLPFLALLHTINKVVVMIGEDLQYILHEASAWAICQTPNTSLSIMLRQ
jgi:hypothetical protein